MKNKEVKILDTKELVERIAEEKRALIPIH